MELELYFELGTGADSDVELGFYSELGKEMELGKDPDVEVGF